MVDRVRNLSGSGWLAKHGFGFGFIGFLPNIDFQVYRVFGFEKVTKIHNFCGLKILHFVDTIILSQNFSNIYENSNFTGYFFCKNVNVDYFLLKCGPKIGNFSKFFAFFKPAGFKFGFGFINF